VQKPHPDRIIREHAGIPVPSLVSDRISLIPNGGQNQIGWFILAHIYTILIAIVGIGRLSEREKDLEILVLR
jgi:hypothetical protein